MKVKNHLPEQNFKSMIYMLRKFLGFMNLTVSVSLLSYTGHGSSIGSDAAWDASGTKIDPRVRHIVL